MKKYFTFIIALFLLIILNFGCVNKTEPVSEANNDYLILATLFQQHASENRALAYQAYNTAKLMLDNSLKRSNLTKKLAVVVDIDETVLDNSPFEAKSIIENTDYPKYWNEWCELAIAQPIAGSVEFLNYAKSKDVEVFYITNRKIILKDVTLKNLQEKGFPYADEKHILMRTDKSNKEPRRKIVEKDYHIVLFVGDNLGDFMHEFDGVSNKERTAITDSLKYDFGTRFIVIPNTMYGGWVNELFNNDFNISKEEKIKLLKHSLISFQ